MIRTICQFLPSTSDPCIWPTRLETSVSRGVEVYLAKPECVENKVSLRERRIINVALTSRTMRYNVLLALQEGRCVARLG